MCCLHPTKSPNRECIIEWQEQTKTNRQIWSSLHPHTLISFIFNVTSRTSILTASSTCAKWLRKGTFQHALGRPIWKGNWNARKHNVSDLASVPSFLTVIQNGFITFTTVCSSFQHIFSAAVSQISKDFLGERWKHWVEFSLETLLPHHSSLHPFILKHTHTDIG